MCVSTKLVSEVVPLAPAPDFIPLERDEVHLWLVQSDRSTRKICAKSLQSTWSLGVLTSGKRCERKSISEAPLSLSRELKLFPTYSKPGKRATADIYTPKHSSQASSTWLGALLSPPRPGPLAPGNWV